MTNRIFRTITAAIISVTFFFGTLFVACDQDKTRQGMVVESFDASALNTTDINVVNESSTDGDISCVSSSFAPPASSTPTVISVTVHPSAAPVVSIIPPTKK